MHFIYVHLTSSVYSKWNDQWLKSVFHLSDFNPFHLNTKFCRRFEAQQRRRKEPWPSPGIVIVTPWRRTVGNRFMLASCVTIAVGGQLEIFHILLTNNEKIKSAEMFLWIKRLNLSLWGRRKCFYLTRSACWERHGYVLWGCGGIMEGTMEGMLMTHEHPKYCGQWRWSKRIQMILKIQTVQISQMKWNEWFHHDHSIITTSWLNSCWF